MGSGGILHPVLVGLSQVKDRRRNQDFVTGNLISELTGLGFL